MASGAQCYKCSKALVGSWNMTESSTTYQKTGRYLGISDGYFLYGSSNWVYCYCQTCWQSSINSLSFSETSLQLQQANNQVTQLNTTKSTLENQLQQANNQVTQLNTTKSTLENQLQQANNQVTQLNTTKSTLENQLQQANLQISSLNTNLQNNESRKSKLVLVEKIFEDPVVVSVINTFQQFNTEEKEILNQHDSFSLEKFMENLLLEQITSAQSCANRTKQQLVDFIQNQSLRMENDIKKQENLINQFRFSAESLPVEVLNASLKPLQDYLQKLITSKTSWNSKNLN
eukprot:TRINITY_DN674_c0_g1_i1.p1 TRINITY_DN674_c0_g1~~TRINITY_DN674_c0_g1_i1.p1  ORF type:complete len:289 (-),score=15.03 TRINITY_DN674_c0_g1_i1:77-943(-)